MHLPSLADMDAAASEIYKHLPPTPQYRWPLLCEHCGTDVWVKHENTTPIGSFKIRGGINYLRNTPHDKVIAATRGNHGQSIAYAAGLFGKKATVVAPRGNSTSKNRAMRSFGAELIEYGVDFSEAHEYAHALAADLNMHFVPSFDIKLVTGVASYALELFRSVENLDAIYVPIGLGSEICAVIAAREALKLNTQIIGVVAENAPTYALSFEKGQPISTDSADTLADGVAVRVPDEDALEVILQHAARVVTVSEQQIADAVRIYFNDTHHVIEGAGASTLAALIKEKSRMKGMRVGVIASGGNIDSVLFQGILSSTIPANTR